MSRDDFLRYMAQYGSNIYDSPSYEGFQIFLSEQNKQIPDRRDGTQHPNTISEEKMEKELSQTGSSHSNSLSQSKTNTTLVQDGHYEATSELYCVPELLEEIKNLKWISKEKDVQVEKLIRMNNELTEINKQDSEFRKRMNVINEFMEKHFPDSFPPSG